MKYEWLNKDSRDFLNRGYIVNQTPEERIRDIAETAEKILKINGFADKFEDYMSRGWYSLSSPIWANFGNDRGLGISCFGTEYQDETSDILRGVSEIGMMTKMGGGTAGYFGNLRPRGSSIKDNGTSNGSVMFIKIYNTMMNVISQGSTRRGNYAAYLPIDHGDIHEFLRIREEGHPIQDLSFAVTIPEGWMQEMIDGDKEKREIWAKVLKKRSETGYPYLFFADNVNKNKPQVYKDKGLEIKTSQLCSEILEYTSEDKSFTCCLSSMNLLHYDDWKDTDAVKTLTYFLDAVLTEFIEKASKIPYFEKAVKFAKEHRSIGLGVLGWHSLLQSKMIPFESMEAKYLNNDIFKNINEQSLEASKELAHMFGEPFILLGYGERFSTRLAIAPTTSSSFILGQISPSIEPLHSNYFVKDLAKGKFVYKNPYLKKILSKKGKDTPEVWKSILMKGGSVQHLNFLTDIEKGVFKTFGEISQMEIITQASQRQKYIDQGQSLNVMIHPDTSVKDINKLIIEAWKLGIKTLYYQRSANVAQEVGRDINVCISCES